MMDASEIINLLVKNRIQISESNGELLLKSQKGNLTDEFVSIIRNNKAALVDALKEQAQIQIVASNLERITPFARSAGSNYRLSYAQQRLWFIDRLEEGSARYNMPAVLRIEGEFDVDAAEQAIGSIIQRHEPLRTIFVEEDGEPFQCIESEFDFSLTRHNLSELDDIEQNQRVKQLLGEDSSRAFNLNQDLMVRASYVQLSKGASHEGVLLFNMHHIASDGWSMGVLVREFVQQYQAIIEDQPDPLEPLSIQYADYAHWQRDQGLEAQLSYWQTQLEELPVTHSLPLDNPRPKQKAHSGKVVMGRLSRALSERVQLLARDHDLTLFMLLHGALSLVLSRHSNSYDIVVGTPVANRTQAELEPLIGFFVNTLVLRTNTDYVLLADYLAHVRQTNLDAQAHQEAPFENLVEQAQVFRSNQHTPLFQIMFAMNTTESAELTLPGVRFSSLGSEETVAKFDLDIGAQLGEEGIEFSWVYDDSLFDRRSVEILNEHVLRLLESMVENPKGKLSELSILSDAETEYLLSELNETTVEYPQIHMVHALFEEQAAENPDNVAVVFEGESLTYQQLNERSNQLAHHLRSLGVGPETMVGVCVERSLEMLIGIISILKAGGSYVPLDPAYPQARLRYMVEDTKLKFLLTQSRLKDILPPLDKLKLIEMDVPEYRQIAESREVRNPDYLDGQTTASLAYVIYTSGSTGQPKGVMIEHRNACAMINWALTVYDKAHQRSMLAATSMCFDLSIFEMFVPLASGGKLTLVNSIMDLHEGSTDISFINTVPSAIKALLDGARIPNSVRTVNLAGELLEQSLVDRLYDAGIERVYDLYGPSEDTTYSTFALREKGGRNSIGRPIFNTKAYILSAKLECVPFGVAGELYLGGAGVSRGYLNSPELTQAKYISNPFCEDEQDRLYKTGDLVRYLEDGNLEFIGRIDEQVKIRGYRIELGEIEYQLNMSGLISSSLVLAREGIGSEKSLVAYVIKNSELELGDQELVQQLRNQLRAALPDYMVPAAIVAMEEWPLTANGKTDKQALPAPDGTLLQLEYVAPENDTEKTLTQIWAKLLNVDEDKLSVSANFFELGGHSLLAVRLINAISEKFELNLNLVEVRDIFSSYTLADLAKIVDLALVKERQDQLKVMIDEESDLEEGEI